MVDLSQSIAVGPGATRICRYGKYMIVGLSRNSRVGPSTDLSLDIWLRES